MRCVADLARELGVPLGVLRAWLYDLVAAGRFSGYINWDEGLLYSAEAQALRAAGHCPRCGGELALAWAGVICGAHCGAETFL
jgi:hypothetical protein